MVLFGPLYINHDFVFQELLSFSIKPIYCITNLRIWNFCFPYFCMNFQIELAFCPIFAFLSIFAWILNTFVCLFVCLNRKRYSIKRTVCGILIIIQFFWKKKFIKYILIYICLFGDHIFIFDNTGGGLRAPLFFRKYWFLVLLGPPPREFSN